MAVKRSLHTAEELSAVLAELEKQTDRGAAIIAASVAEELLAVLIQERLLPLNSEVRQSLFDRPNAPLRGFSAKISLGYALGLYSLSGMNSLHMLREARNKFAHRIEALNFEHPEILAIVTPITNQLTTEGLTTRNKFLIVFRLMSVIFIGHFGRNIRIPDLGETRPEIMIETVSAIAPEYKNLLQAALRDANEAAKGK